MDFDFSEEQQLLKDSVTRLLADRYDFEARKRYLRAPDGFSGEIWQQFADLGILGVAVPEEDGGFGGGPVEIMIVMEQFGRALVVEPFLSTIVLGGALLRLAGTDQQRAALLPGVVDGSLRIAFAHHEPQSGHDLFDVAATARRDGEDFILDGQKGLVLQGDSAQKLIVSARFAGSRRDKGGLGLFIVDATAPGVTRRGYPTQDGMRAAEVALEGVRVSPSDVLGDPGGAYPIIERAMDEGIAALCAEAVGAMSEALDLTVDYMKQRKQFGVPIGSFQVLQHRASDMVVALEQARSMAMLATMMARDPDPVERRKAVAAAKVQIGRSARFIGQQAVQLHGGMGMTMEYKVGHLFKRLTMIDAAFGDADHHLDRFAETEGFVTPL